ncbi:MAG: hypothetical protein HY832_01505 [Candidatus Aenigmarchaeota archaeon]|nr:hypothetical protein [Candidatus Aenigmarchaeota archaeon]
MGRKKGFNRDKIASILSVLVRYPEGTWIRALAAECHLAPNTVRYYIQTVLSALVIDTSLGRSEKPHLRVIRLKPLVLQQLQEGKDLRQIMKLLNMVNKIE